MSAPTPEVAPRCRNDGRGKDTESSVKADTVILALFGVGAYLLSIKYEGLESLYEFSRTYEDWELDEIFTAFLIFLFGLAIFAIRRVSDLRAEIAHRKTAEQGLISCRADLQRRVDAATAELRTTARELEAALAREREINELQRQFVSMASHEFRTPLAIIDGIAQRMKRRADRLTPQEAIERVDKIRAAVARMTRLMESTLMAARRDQGQVGVDIRPCDVRRVIGDVCARQQEIARKHNISCDCVDLPETIQADSSALDQILTNLLSNAVKYSPASPDIAVKAFGDGDHVVIQVSDRGLGIDADDLPQMFGRFFRARNSTGIVGTGIGLNLVKTLVEMHGGSVGVDSTLGEGSTFAVRLPIQGPAGIAAADGVAA